jgi:hypothetical protein
MSRRGSIMGAAVGLGTSIANEAAMQAAEATTQTAATADSIETLGTEFEEQKQANAQSETTMAINDMKIG